MITANVQGKKRLTTFFEEWFDSMFLVARNVNAPKQVDHEMKTNDIARRKGQ